MRPATVGVFDSGVGGLSVYREIARQIPHADGIYFADQANCPYGTRPAAEVCDLSRAITGFLLSEGADVIVVACNTASAAALSALRQAFHVPIVGMEPAVKPAAAQTRTGHIGVLATEVTFQGQLYASLLDRFSREVTVHTQVCPGLVECVEAGAVDGKETLTLLRQCLKPLMDAHVDTLVLGCTHYPFLLSAIAHIAGPTIKVIDPSSAVARQTGRVLARARPVAQRDRRGAQRLYTTGDLERFDSRVEQLLGARQCVRAVRWSGNLDIEGTNKE